MKPNKEIDTALHVLKGAAVKVINTALTTGVWAEGTKGRLTLQCQQKPSDALMQQIESLANKKINENVPIEMLQMDRTEAEHRYGNIIYDKFPVPEHIGLLTLTIIPDWNINCCCGPHLGRTGELGQLRIRDCRFRAGRKELEISFEVAPK